MRRFRSPSKDGLPKAGNLANVGYILLSALTSAIGAGALVGLGTFLFRKRVREARAAAVMAFAVAIAGSGLRLVPVNFQRDYWLSVFAALFIWGIIALLRNLARPSVSKE